MGLVFILVYALPLFMPPPGRPFVAPTDDASLFTRIFPYCPAYWAAARLVPRFGGAALIASIVKHPVVRPLRRLAPDVASPREVHRSTPPPLQYAALLAAAAQAACIPWVSRLPPVCQSLYMVWLFVPSLLLAWGVRRPAAGSPSAQPAWQWTVRVVGALIAFWLVTRLFISWHSARAADVVDMWRMFAGLSLMVQRGGNFLVESVGPELPGVNAVPFF